MSISVFNLFNIGIGPSSSHTIGPMRAAHGFIEILKAQKKLTSVERIEIELFGSLAYTGKGHGTDKAVLLGLEGHLPDTIDPSIVDPRMKAIITTRSMHLAGSKKMSFDYVQDLLFNYKELLPFHSNALRFKALDASKQIICAQIYYSVGGGFILTQEEAEQTNNNASLNADLPYPFSTALELFNQCKKNHLAIHELMLANEMHYGFSQAEVYTQIYLIADTMENCIRRGCEQSGILPGGLNVKRRAYDLHQKLLAKGMPSSYEHIDSMNWLNLYAIAVNEENAAGGRVVTAPTNGAAGIVPAVLEFYKSFYPQVSQQDIAHFLLTAGAIAILYKKGASISGAEVGCQGEVGVASSMAAGAFAAALGGSLDQIENAAEIAMEHHLGMTCDPVAGLVQIPCIERNAMGAVKAVNAARLALLGDGQHKISLDKAIATMKQTGKDMMSIYKETSLGGLAANLPEC